MKGQLARQLKQGVPPDFSPLACRYVSRTAHSVPTASSPGYRQHHPEETPLYALVEEQLPSFMARAESGICRSCNARRMADTAARLVGDVLPDARLCQWVLSEPFELRLLLAKKPEALSAVGRIFIEEIFRWQRSPGIRMGPSTATAAKERLRGGTICFPQRFGGSLNLKVHYHVIVPDALFYRDVSGNIATEILRRRH